MNFSIGGTGSVDLMTGDFSFELELPFIKPAGGLVDPATIVDYWWDPTDVASITESGGVVSQWNDQIEGRVLQQTNAPDRPTLTTKNGIQAMQMYGSPAPDPLDFDFAVPIAPSYMIAAFFGAEGFGTDNSRGMLAGKLGPANAFIPLAYNNDLSTAWEINYAGAQWWKNGVDVTPATRDEGFDTINDNFVWEFTGLELEGNSTVENIGSRGNSQLYGVLGDVMFMNTAPTVQERAQLLAYLQDKWAL